MYKWGTGGRVLGAGCWVGETGISVVGVVNSGDQQPTLNDQDARLNPSTQHLEPGPRAPT
jgi:hypothetical protein